MNEITATNHAYVQYCNRVGQIDRNELTVLLTDLMREPQRQDGDLVCLDGVWWVLVNNTFITCYGETHMDLPAAISWAKMHGDRIVL